MLKSPFQHYKSIVKEFELTRFTFTQQVGIFSDLKMACGLKSSLSKGLLGWVRPNPWKLAITIGNLWQLTYLILRVQVYEQSEWSLYIWQLALVLTAAGKPEAAQNDQKNICGIRKLRPRTACVQWKTKWSLYLTPSVEISWPKTTAV